MRLFEVIYYDDMNEVIEHSKICHNEEHVQQAIYSVYHTVLTQICFDCAVVRTNMPR